MGSFEIAIDNSSLNVLLRNDGYFEQFVSYFTNDSARRLIVPMAVFAELTSSQDATDLARNVVPRVKKLAKLWNSIGRNKLDFASDMREVILSEYMNLSTKTVCVSEDENRFIYELICVGTNDELYKFLEKNRDIHASLQESKRLGLATDKEVKSERNSLNKQDLNRILKDGLPREGLLKAGEFAISYLINNVLSERLLTPLPNDLDLDTLPAARMFVYQAAMLAMGALFAGYSDMLIRHCRPDWGNWHDVSIASSVVGCKVFIVCDEAFRGRLKHLCDLGICEFKPLTLSEFSKEICQRS